MDAFRIAGDALWILSLALMAGSARQAMGRVKPGARVPLFGVRTPPVVGFWAVLALALLASLGLAWIARSPAGQGEMRLILLGVRALAASLFALLHFTALTGALRVLAREGQLKP